MSNPLRILLVEDSEDDALLVLRELRKDGRGLVSDRVDTPESLKGALAEKTWDAVLSDYSMPGFTGLDALDLLKESGRDIPFLVVSGKIGEETAVELMRTGAHDYIMKDKLTRLGPAVDRELREAGIRRERHEAQLQVQKQLQRITALRNIDMAITSSLDLRVTLNVFLDQVVGQLHVDAAAVLLLNSHAQVLEYAAGRGLRSRQIERTAIRLGSGTIGRSALERRSVHIPDLDEVAPEQNRSALFEAEGFCAHFAVPLVAKGHVKGVLELFHRTPFSPDADWLDFLDALAGQAAIAIDAAALFDDLQRSNIELRLAYDTTIEGWSRALDLRDRETEGHSQRVADMTVRVARTLELGEEEIVHMRRGALLHDIGKMGIPDRILHKPRPLTEEEHELMNRHPQIAYELLAPIAFLRPAIDIPYAHHERWDGTGYPRGLKGKQIPLAARIFAVVDVHDALVADRPYHHGWEEEQIRNHFRAGAESHFDPHIVQVFLEMVW